MTALTEFLEIANDPFAYGKKMKQTGGRKIVGYFCSYAPEELIHAAGAHPFRIFGTGDNIHLADAHFQSYCCSLVRGALEGILTERLDFLDGIVFPHTCDSIQRLSDVWRINIKKTFHLDIVLPVRLDTQSALDYLTDVLNKFKKDLEIALETSFTFDDLAKSIAAYNRIRNYLHRIYEIKSANPDVLTGAELYAVSKAAMIMDRNRLLETLPLFIDDLLKKKVGESNDKKQLVLAGGICTHSDIYRIIEDAGGTVIGDDLCTGSRYFAGLTAETGDPIKALAKRFIDRPPCPAKHAGLFTRAEHLVNTVKEKNAQGVIFLFLKFCDPHAFDYPYLKDCLDREGIPSIMIEVEDQLASTGQLQTRLETFMHMI